MKIMVDREGAQVVNAMINKAVQAGGIFANIQAAMAVANSVEMLPIVPEQDSEIQGKEEGKQ